MLWRNAISHHHKGGTLLILLHVSIYIYLLLLFVSIEESDPEEDVPKQNYQRKFTPSTWDGLEIEIVSRLPESGIDGLKIYELEATTPDFNNQGNSKDGRKWKKANHSFWKDFGKVRSADCQGSHECQNANCDFRTEYGIINITQFEKGKDGS